MLDSDSSEGGAAVPPALRGQPAAVRDDPVMRDAAAMVEAMLGRFLRAPVGAQGDVAAVVFAAVVLTIPVARRGDLLGRVLEDFVQAGTPVPQMGPIVQEARGWASVAGPHELEAYLWAICDLLPVKTGRVGGEAQRKRLMLELWESIPDAWRRRFIAKVTG